MMTNQHENSQFPSFLHHFDFQVQSDPMATALVVKGNTFSYRDLATMATIIAANLRQLGVGSGAKVAVGVERTEALLPLLLAIWSLRSAYIPVDPNYPADRQSYILDHAGVETLVTDTVVPGLEYQGKTVTLESLLVPPPTPISNLNIAATETVDEDLAYVIYTSGSTGKPKGVAIHQGNVLNFVLAMRDAPGLNKGDRLLAVTTISFDIHVLELFLPMLVGAQIILATKEQSISPQTLHQFIDDYVINVVQATPATWRMLLANKWQPKMPFKILVGGEALPRDLRPLMHQVSTELWNMYGPTETTVWSTCQKITENDQVIYIGRPIRQTTVFVVDEHFKEVPKGSSGELLIGGAGVSSGYYNRPDLTAERFIDLPGVAQGKVYRTGDLVIQHPDGALQYVNRLDNQIKIRGYRIEPADIEHNLEQHPAVSQAVVVACNFDEQDVRLIAYYLGEEVDSSELLKWCVSHLPAHMVPQYVVHLPAFPMTANYKVDRKHLAADGINRVKTSVSTAETNCRDDLDRSLAAVWEKILGISGVGIDDNFFEIGGHSLLALQAAKDMSTASGLEFSETVLFESPTIRAVLASMGDETERAASVVKLNSAKSGAPIFCLAGVNIYKELAEHFNDQRPVYGVFAKREVGFLNTKQGDSGTDSDYGNLVQSYVDAIKRQGDIQKLSLVGLSFGGLLALEVAEKLRAQGVELGEVVMLDSYRASSVHRSATKVFADCVNRAKEFGVFALFNELLGRARKKLGSTVASTDEQFSLQSAEDLRSKAFDRATDEFDFGGSPYHIDALLIKATETDFGFGRRPQWDYGLRQFIKGKFTVKEVRASHQLMVAGAEAGVVYQLIQDYASESK